MDVAYANKVYFILCYVVCIGFLWLYLTHCWKHCSGVTLCTRFQKWVHEQRAEWCTVCIRQAHDLSLSAIQQEPSYGGMQSSIFLCLSQARINWEGCDRQGIRRKNGRLMEMAWWLVWMEWYPPGLSVWLPCYRILPSTIQSRRKFLLAPAHPVGAGKMAVKRLWWHTTGILFTDDAELDVGNEFLFKNIVI